MFKRLFLIFLGLVIVVYAVIAVFFLRYVQQQRKIEMTGHITRVSTSASVIEQQIQAVTNVQVQLVNDTRIKRWVRTVTADPGLGGIDSDDTVYEQYDP